MVRVYMARQVEHTDQVILFYWSTNSFRFMETDNFLGES